MTKYHLMKGGLETAQLALSKLGGQMFPARDSEGPFIHVHGSNVYTYWPEQSKRRGYVMELAKTVGFDPEIATTSRIIKHIINDVLAVPYKETFFCQKWRGLAVKGEHWHYLYCKPGQYEYCMEIDLKSAYWSAFAGEKSMLLNQHKEWLNDDGALDSLNTLVQGLPKAFRLALLGSFASWRHTYWVVDKKAENGQTIKAKTAHEIKYGAAFNAAHRAILKVYKVMQHIHKICGEDVIRIHTDGVILNCCNDMKWEAELDDFIKRSGFDYSVKGQGQTWMIDVNTGVLGKKVMGSRRIVIDEAKAAGIKINLNAQPPKPSIFLEPELPPSVAAEVSMNPTGIPTQTALDFSVYGIV